MESSEQHFRRIQARQAERSLGPHRLGEDLGAVLDRGDRQSGSARGVAVDSGDGSNGQYRARTPTNSERLNRALTELGPSAFKVHILVWKWRGAPARGVLPFFTIHGLAKFCSLSRPTVRVALCELTRKGWILRLPYNKHHKNTLYRLVPIRKVPAPKPAPICAGGVPAISPEG